MPDLTSLFYKLDIKDFRSMAKRKMDKLKDSEKKEVKYMLDALELGGAVLGKRKTPSAVLRKPGSFTQTQTASSC